MNTILIVGYFVGMIITLTIFRCAGWVAHPDDDGVSLPPAALIGVFWPIAITVVLIIKFFSIVIAGSVNFLVKKFCPNKEQ